ncbi:uncharacterized protein LOC111916013 [Lactuca sativa]|uniref:NusG-like N-terminal domain-containing protein n=1 Tax=Lactuca sativa TaxID=4236 RepID=A0A9R1WHE3_LACSA|nr:uncharacterized protein LOC111916013 [Lactuca sativa]KAJ0223963.1 hypothetical protein LSAT_V11C200076410 [Lactuca sativa]
MNQELLLSWRRPCLPFPTTITKPTNVGVVFQPIRATLQTSVDEKAEILTAKEKRELRNVKREENKSYNWREDVEERLLKKPKKQFNSWKEELNLDKLAVMGPQWWIVKVSRAKGKDTVERMMQALAKNFPDAEFQVFTAAVSEKTKLKNGKISIKPKPLYPGCVFLNCILNRELHNFIREECEGVGGFVGRMVGNTKKQINKPRPVSAADMEAIFQEVKEKQEATDKTFEEQQQLEILEKKSLPLSDKKVSKSRSRKPSGPVLGSTVRIVSGPFLDFSGTIKKLDRKRGSVTVGFTLFGKDTLADLDVSEIVEEKK